MAQIALNDRTLDAFSLPRGGILETVFIPAGTFVMGSAPDEPGRMEWEIPHTVTLTADFRMGKYPVTQAQYQEMTGTNPAWGRAGGDACPVENVSWQDALAFCRKLTERHHAALPDGYVFALPTEAQWEYACRAGETSASASGDVAWTCENSAEAPMPVGQKQPNAWGLYDMRGNIREWCMDYASEYSGDAVDPVGPVLANSGLSAAAAGTPPPIAAVPPAAPCNIRKNCAT